MEIIYFTGISEHQFLRLKEIAGDFVLEEYNDQELLAGEVALFLLGEEQPDMMRTAQQINKKYPELGVLILPAIPDSNIHQLKMALQFSPFINQNVKVLETADPETLQNIILTEAKRTLQRKKHKKTVRSVSNSVSSQQGSYLPSTFLDNFLRQAPIGVVLLNTKNTILDINSYGKNLLGLNDNILSTSFLDIFKSKKQAVSSLLNHKTKPEEDVVVEINRNGDGKRYIQLNSSTVVTANAEYKMVLVQNITGEIIAEQKVQDYLKELEKHNKELEQFARVVSHDLKNPLSTITLSCEMADEEPAEETGKYIKIIRKSADNLLQMIQGLEEMIDIRRGSEQQISKCFFQEIYNDVFNEYQYKINHDDVKITCDFKKAPSIDYVKSYLFSIFHNMINNAIKYKKEDEPLRLHITTELKKPFVLLKFADNGIGIDLQKHSENLFQPFKRFSKQATGKGIGLSIIKSMIEKNNGKIEVESTPGIGTTFLCFLRSYETDK